MFLSVSFIAIISNLFIGVGLSAASGFRVFLPMFIVSLASFMGWIHVGENFSWLANIATLLSTGVATIVEIVAYYIPYIDNLLDTITVPLSTVAGSVLFASQFTDVGMFPHWALALIAGGGTAAAISGSLAGTRVASTASTGGIGNNIIASAETIGAGFLSALALFIPWLATIFVIILLVVIIFFGRKILLNFKEKLK